MFRIKTAIVLDRVDSFLRCSCRSPSSPNQYRVVAPLFLSVLPDAPSPDRTEQIFDLKLFDLAYDHSNCYNQDSTLELLLQVFFEVKAMGLSVVLLQSAHFVVSKLFIEFNCRNIVFSNL